MDKTDPPESFGVLKPEGHALMAFANEQAASDAAQALQEAGLAGGPGGLQRWTDREMQTLAQEQLAHASTAASFGYEINLVREYGVLAERGCHFIAVRCADDAARQKLQQFAGEHGAVAAQAYGRWMHQDLLSHPGGPTSGERLDEATNAQGSDDTATRAAAAEPPSILDDPVAQLAPGHHPARQAAEARARRARETPGRPDEDEG